ncbi:MAG: pyrroline-5-carboxylate reductase [Eubacteriales bacterium]|nr:pyrroline-5-carboxylate reductase [Eubacteriales bacterium]MDY3332171.1 pyrroline-5-carboxylate reductase [Gallibacter sp.]
MNIGFLGAGNMGGAILRGYIASKDGKANDDENIFVFGVNRDKLSLTCSETGANPCYEIEDLVEKCDIIFLGVKPNIFDEILPVVAKKINSSKVIVSMAAGISISYIKKHLGRNVKVVRIMPNTPARVGLGMTSISTEDIIEDGYMSVIKKILSGIGVYKLVDESQIHNVIGVSGSSPAYTYLYIDALIESAKKNGMTETDAKLFAVQAVKGAAQMVLDSEDTPSELAEKVCSKGGTTIEAVNVLKENDFKELVEKAYQAAVDKSKKLEK